MGVGHAGDELLDGAPRRGLDPRAASAVVFLEQALHLPGNSRAATPRVTRPRAALEAGLFVLPCKGVRKPTKALQPRDTAYEGHGYAARQCHLSSDRKEKPIRQGLSENY